MFAELPFITILQEVTFWFSQPVYIVPCILCAIDMLSSWTFGIRHIDSRTSSENRKSLKRICSYRDGNALSPFISALYLLRGSWGGHGVPLGQRNDLHVPGLLERISAVLMVLDFVTTQMILQVRYFRFFFQGAIWHWPCWLMVLP